MEHAGPKLVTGGKRPTAERMSEFLAFSGVIAIWFGLSAGAWRLHQAVSGRARGRQKRLAERAASEVAAAPFVFARIRGGAGAVDGPSQDHVLETHALLKRIQEHGAYFDAVNRLRAQLRRVLKGEDCPPLSEVLHIRRDLWAASEIVLVEDVRSLGPEFADAAAYERFRAEAGQLLFQRGDGATDGGDLIALRLAMAQDEARQFVAEIVEAIRAAEQNERLPTYAEIAAYPLAAARALPGQLRALRDQAVIFHRQVYHLAAAIRQSQTMARGVEELRRTRQELPGRLARVLDTASAGARQSAASLKSHYEFLSAAYSFQAKYEDLLRKAPVMTERGKQFIARLELAEKSERLKLTTATLRDAAKRLLLRGLAHMIAGLQRLQNVLEKQLASAAAASAKSGEAGRTRETQRPLAVSLDPPPPLASAPAHAAPLAASSHAKQPIVSAEPAPAIRATLAAKLTGLSDHDPGDDLEPACEPGAEDEDGEEDTGPLTRSILQSRIGENAKPGRARAFPWLRR